MRVALLASEAQEVPTGMDATVVATGARAWPGAIHVDDLHDRFDVALACGWRAALHLFRVPAAGYAYLVRGLEHALLYQGDEQRILAAVTYDLPCDLIVETAALEHALADAHPGARIHRIPLAPQPREFLHAPPRADGAPLRVTVAESTDDAKAAAVLERSGGAVERHPDAHVLLDLAPAELPLRATLGALRAGMPAIVTPALGHDELISDGSNGFVCEFDDVPGIAERLGQMAGDTALLGRMSEEARRTGAALPTATQAAQALHDVLAGVAGGEPPRGWPTRLLLSALAAAQPVSQERHALGAALRARERDVERLQAENEQLRAELEGGLLRRLRRR